MELRHLRYFVGVAEEENVSRAALKLHISQPALSRQIRDLEEELGVELLMRGARSVKLTEAGRAFLLEAQNVLQAAERAVKTAKAVASGDDGELNIGYAPSPTARILPNALRSFQALRPKVRVKLHDLTSAEILLGLREGRLHFSLMVKPSAVQLRGLRFEELVREPLCLAVAPSHRFAGLTKISLPQVAKEPLIAFGRKEYPEFHEILSSIFGKIKQAAPITEEHDSVHSLIAAVEAGGGVALALESMVCTAGPRLKLIPFAPSVGTLAIGAAWSRGGLTTTAEQFLECARREV